MAGKPRRIANTQAVLVTAIRESFMKTFILFAGFLAAWSPHALAQSDSIEEQKSKIIAHIDLEMSALATQKSCVQEATDKKALSRCHRAAREVLRDLRQEKRRLKREGK